VKGESHVRKLLLTGVLALAPLAAFAGGNLAQTSANSSAEIVDGIQGTGAHALVGGNGGVIVGAVSGNYSTVGTSGVGRAGPLGSYTNTTVTQTNVGGTVSGGLATNQKLGGASNGASGSAGGFQSSQTKGGSDASASTTNFGGFATTPRNFGHY
jgi:hypothetical protein